MDHAGTLSVHEVLFHRGAKVDIVNILVYSTDCIKVVTLSDESIDIVSGLQLAGLRHVVASLGSKNTAFTWRFPRCSIMSCSWSNWDL